MSEANEQRESDSGSSHCYPWIRVRDQLPPEGVLVLAELGLEHVIGKRSGNEFEIPNWTAKMKHVGYWMKLPAIPEPYDG